MAALVERSNRLGRDPKNTNYAGGNTSAKGTEVDPVTGEDVELVWVKGSGGDLGTLTESGLAVLRLDRMRALTQVYPGVEREDEMVAAFDYCLHGKGGAAPVDRHRDARPGRLRARRPPPPRLRHRDRDGRRRRGADQGDLRRPGRLGALASSGLPARPRHRRHQGGQPAGRRLHPRRPRHHRVGRHQRGVRDELAVDHRHRRGLHRRAQPRPSRSARRSTGTPPSPRPSVAPRPPPSPRPSAGWRPRTGRWSATSPTPTWSSTSSASAEHPRLAGLGTSCPDHFLRTKVKPLVARPARDRVGRGDDRAAQGAARSLPRGLPGATTTATPPPTGLARRSAAPTR